MADTRGRAVVKGEHFNRRQITRRRRLTAALATVGIVATGLALGEVAQAAPPEIVGHVYRDHDNDGTDDGDLEPQEEGITVRAFAEDGTVTPPVTTDEDGEYTIELAGLPGTRFRVEFSGWPDHLEPAPHGTGNPGSVQFAEDGDVVDFGLHNPAQYCQQNPDMVTACFRGGSATANDGLGALASFPSTAGTTSTSSNTNLGTPLRTNLVDEGDIGPTAGLAYDRDSESIFAGAWAQRHTAYPGASNGNPNHDGPDTIYVYDRTSGDFAELIDIEAGSDNHVYSNLVADTAYWNQVGTTAWGDLEVAEDGSVLYAANLFDRSIKVIELVRGPDAGDPADEEVTAGDVSSIDLGDLAQPCSDDDWRPGGILARDGLVYFGLTCTAATSGDRDDLQAVVGAYDPDDSSLTEVARFDLDYDRGYATAPSGGNSAPAEWFPWAASEALRPPGQPTAPYGQAYYPQPHVMDLQIDDLGRLIVGIHDRGGSQFGNDKNASPAGNHEGVSAGDVLVLDDDGDGTWSNPQDELLDTERYALSSSSHQETSLGNLAHQAGTGEIASTAMDPGPVTGSVTVPGPLTYSQSFRAGGVIWMDLTDGDRTQSYQVYGMDEPGTFGKAAGLGDLELLCDAAPIEIGNYVWLDADQDGTQDPQEAPIEGVTIRLYDEAGVVVETTTTDASGRYWFTVEPGTEYTVRADRPEDRDPGGPLAGLSPTTADAETVGDGDDDVRDSDGVVGDLLSLGSEFPEVDLSTRRAGANDHTYDFGFADYRYDLALIKTLADGQATEVREGDTVDFEITVKNQGDLPSGAYQVTDTLPEGTSFSSAGQGGVDNGDGTVTWTAAEQDELAVGETATFTLQVTVEDAGEAPFTNTAEISDDSGDDEDSTPDTDPSDDPLVDHDDIDHAAPNDDPDDDQDDHDVASVVLRPTYDLALIKTLADGQATTVLEGDEVDFTITVKNQGDVSSGAYEVTDTLPGGTSFVSAGQGGVDNGDGTVTWTVDAQDALAPGESATFDLTVEIDDIDEAPFTNTAEISDDSGDDEDSTPDADPDDDPLVDHDDIDHGAPNDDPDDDQDDHDVASVDEVPLASLGDYVWHDQDRDGMQDGAETGVNGVTVTLLDASGNPVVTDGRGNPVSPQVTTDGPGGAGWYEFGDLAPGSYRVEFSDLPDGFVFTTQGGNPADGTDSNADPTTGRTAVVELSAGEHDPTIDAGIWEPIPVVDITKYVNGADANAAPGILVPTGDTVTFSYVVTNVGNETLVQLQVTDDQGVSVSCPQTALAVGASMTCTGTAAAVAGQYTNVGTVTGQGQVSGDPVEDDDPANYTGVSPLIDIEKHVEGEDADTAGEAVEVAAGSDVTWTFTVTNTGTETVEQIVVTDDQYGAVTCPQTSLAPGASMDCSAIVEEAPDGPFVNVAGVTGVGAISGDQVGDTDPAHVFGQDPRVTLLKEVLHPYSGTYLDADADAGTLGSNDATPATLAAGSTATFRFQVSNAGNVDLTDVSVADDHCDAAPSLVSGDGGTPRVLDVGETWVLSCTVADVTAGFTNVATVDADSEAGPPEGDGDQERARVQVPGISITKEVRDADGSWVEQATVVRGEDATWRITVTNTGEVPLSQVEVTDALAPACARTFDGVLMPGESFPSYECVLEDVDEDLVNTAAVDGTPSTQGGEPVEEPVDDDDPAEVVTSDPEVADLALVKELESVDADADTATWLITVTNNGPVASGAPVVVADQLPAELRYVSAGGVDAGRWSCSWDDPMVTCTRTDPLTVGESDSLRIVTEVDAAPGQTVVNNASVSSPEEEEDMGNNEGADALVVSDDPLADPLAPETGTLPRTGFDPWRLTWFAMVAITCGGAILALWRRDGLPFNR